MRNDRYRRAVWPPPVEPPAPARLPGVRPSGGYGAGLAALVMGVVVGSLVFSYGYLAINAATWPPEGVPEPALTRPTLATILVLVAGTIVLIARGGLVDESAARRFLPGLVLSFVVGTVGTVFLWIETADQPFAADAHSYAAAVFICLGTALTLLVGCLYMNLFMIACVLRRKVGLEHEGAGHVVRVAWAFTAVASALLVVVVVVGAHVL